MTTRELWILTASETLGYDWYSATNAMEQLPDDRPWPTGWTLIEGALGRGDFISVAVAATTSEIVVGVSGLRSRRTRGTHPVRESLLLVVEKSDIYPALGMAAHALGVSGHASGPVEFSHLSNALIEEPDRRISLNAQVAVDLITKLDEWGFRVSTATTPLPSGLFRDESESREEAMGALCEVLRTSMFEPSEILLVVTDRPPRDLKDCRWALTTHVMATTWSPSAARLTDSLEPTGDDQQESVIPEKSAWCHLLATSLKRRFPEVAGLFCQFPFRNRPGGKRSTP